MLAAISGSVSAPQVQAQQPPAQPAPAAPAQSASLKPDTVSISAQGHAAASAGDVDHDGDSH